MATKLMNLRNVPADELDDVRTLLDDHAIVYHETGAGLFGISLPALWLNDASQYIEARALLDGYAERRAHAAKLRWQSELDAGQQRTTFDIWRERPLQTACYLVLVAGLLYVSTVPFWFMHR
jgi:hypothetical protein